MTLSRLGYREPASNAGSQPRRELHFPTCPPANRLRMLQEAHFVLSELPERLPFPPVDRSSRLTLMLQEDRVSPDLNHDEATPNLQSLADCFENRRDQILNWIRFRIDSRLGGRVDIEDVLQESYMAAASRWKHFPRDGSVDLIVWVRSIVIQTLTDLHRVHLGAQCRDARREIGLPAPTSNDPSRPALADQLVADLTSPSLAVARKETARRIQEALESMSQTDQEILMLRHFDMLDNHEVAQVLGITAKNASIRYVRALKRLKPLLEATQNNDSVG